MQHKFLHYQDMVRLKAQLLHELPRLVEVLFKDRAIQRTTHEYRIGSKGSISIRVADGSYFNHETGEGGDLITLIQHLLKMEFKDALLFAQSFIGNKSVFVLQSFAPLQKKLDSYALQQRSKALAMWNRAGTIAHTLADKYLREYRRISLSPLPSSLRFISHAYNYTAQGFYPAMIGKMQNLQGETIAAHCTFLDKASGTKLAGQGVKPRLIFGSCKGGAIRLAEASQRLAICEGIEDGLSIMQSSPDWPVWVTGGTSNLQSVHIPGYVREVKICADSDTAGQEAARKLSERLIAEGKRVSIAMPPYGVKDFNDLLRGEVRHAQ